jgi:hypothetical protein
MGMSTVMVREVCRVHLLDRPKARRAPLAPVERDSLLMTATGVTQRAQPGRAGR